MTHILRYIIFSIFFFFNYSSHADTIFVNANVDGGLQNGTTWENAFSDLQDALALAEHGDEIWVAQGTYYPTIESDREISFIIPEGVALYGGFVGTETILEERNWEANTSILSGDIGIHEDSLDNSFTVVYIHIMEDDSTRLLNGLSIVGGNANIFNNSPPQFERKKCGGGIYIDGNSTTNSSKVIFENCMVQKNYAEKGGGMFSHGNEITNEVVDIQVKNCIFSENQSRAGGAIYRFGGGKQDVIEITNSIFERNYSKKDGGAVYFANLAGQKYLTFKSCLFIENSSMQAGAAIYIDDYNIHSGLHFLNCDFFRNETSDNGACLYLLSLDNTGNILFENCNVMENSGAGTIAITSFFSVLKNITLINTKFFENYNSGAGILNLYFNVDLNLQNCSFIKNYSSNGSIVDLQFCDMFPELNIVNTLIYNNISTAGSSIEDEGLILIREGNFGNNGNADIHIKNSIIYGNALNSILSENPFNIHTDGTFTIENTLLDVPSCEAISEEPPLCGPGMLYNLDPLFADTAAGDFRLLPCSPAINAGDTSILSQLGILTDIEGNPRISEGGVDLGPFERLPAVLTIDSILPAPCTAVAGGAILFGLDDFCPPLEILWEEDTNTGTGSQNLAAGDYQISITDAMGRMAETTASIPALPDITLETQSTEVDCVGGVGGSITAMPMSGTAPFSYSWSNGMSGAPLQNLPAGNYAVTITDAAGCTAIDSINVTASGLLGIGITVTPISCHDSADGTAAVQAMGGAAPYSYLWMDAQSDSLIQNLSGGDYAVTITDINNCSDELIFSMLPPDSVSLVLETVDVACYGENSGQATVIPEGGTAPYTYIWSNGQTSPTVENLAAGIFDLTVLDAHNCPQQASIAISEPPELTATIDGTDILCFGEMTGSVWVTPIGGTTPYLYEWTNGGTDSLLENLPAGQYDLQIWDSNFCELALSTSISEPDSLTLEMEILHTSTPHVADGSLEMTQIAGATAPYSFLWNTGDTMASLSNLAPGVYSLLVTDAHNCEWWFEYEVSFTNGLFDVAQNADLQLFPNPAGEYLQIHLQLPVELNAKNISLQVVDILGKVLIKQKITPINGEVLEELDLKQFVPGTYFLRIGEAGWWKGSKFVKG